MYAIMYFNTSFFFLLKSISNPNFFYDVYHLYIDLDVLMSFTESKQECFHVENVSKLFYSDQSMDLNHVFSKRHDSTHNVIGQKQQRLYAETQVDLLSKNTNIKSKEDQIVVYNHIESMALKEKDPFVYYIPTPKNEERIPHDLFVLKCNQIEMHEFKHVKEIPSLLTLVHYSLYYSHVNKLHFLHTIKEILSLSHLDRINSELPLNVYRSILDSDSNLVFERFQNSFKDMLLHTNTDLKMDFNIDLSKYKISSTDRKEIIGELFDKKKNLSFKEDLRKQFNNYINSID